MDLNSFVEWSRDNSGCCVDITIGGQFESDPGKVKIWVFSYDLMSGNHVTSVDEIDFAQWRQEEMERKRQEVEKYFKGEKHAAKSI